MHASYSEEVGHENAYCPLRTAQMLQLCRFVRHTRRSDAVQILMGDLNTKPDEECMRLLLDGVPLKDAWLVANGNEDGGTTSNTPDNCYSKNSGSPQRIDWVLYGGGAVHCQRCQVVARGVPGTNICYSDHNGVEAVFQLGSAAARKLTEGELPTIVLYLSSSLDALLFEILMLAFPVTIQ